LCARMHGNSIKESPLIGYLDVGAGAHRDLVGVAPNHGAVPYRTLWRVSVHARDGKRR